LSYDIWHRLRRINFLQGRIDETLAGQPPPEVQRALHQVKRELNEILVDVRRNAQARRHDSELRERLQAMTRVIGHAQLDQVLARATSADESTARARALFEANPPLLEAVTQALGRVALLMETDGKPIVDAAGRV